MIPRMEVHGKACRVSTLYHQVHLTFPRRQWKRDQGRECIDRHGSTAGACGVCRSCRKAGANPEPGLYTICERGQRNNKSLRVWTKSPDCRR